MADTIYLDIVSAEGQIFSGEVSMVFAMIYCNVLAFSTASSMAPII